LLRWEGLADFSRFKPGIIGTNGRANASIAVSMPERGYPDSANRQNSSPATFMQLAAGNNGLAAPAGNDAIVYLSRSSGQMHSISMKSMKSMKSIRA
jgi:hypothetical protein